MKVTNGTPTGFYDVYCVRKMGLPTGRESYGDGVPIVVVGVTSHQGERESRSQGEVEQVSQISCKLRETAKCVLLLNILGLFANVAKKV